MHEDTRAGGGEPRAPGDAMRDGAELFERQAGRPRQVRE